ncbi:spore-associated protein A [Streptomyces sp. Qhu-G9]|uniref:spore-associated protein A n=1 Tax=Streptomyces sp. Qhu-G9 TaxID=3452799 RepID=UPI0022AC3A63|nr:spore-associated protein A [Streptomyces aurantiacus]WAU79280.1 spore-associated protein A [Streptomyces aurantiacus]
MNRWTTLTAAAAAAATSVLAFSGNANAAGANVAYNGACGSGYSVVNSANMQFGAGTVYLTYNGSTGKNCVVTIQTEQKYSGPMTAKIRRTGSSSWTTDSGDYRYYAGPVYVSAAGSCVDWYGSYFSNYGSGSATNCG